MIITKTKRRLFWLIVGALLLLGVIQFIAAGKESDLIISEIMAANQTGLLDEDGDYSDWIELYNRSDTAVNLSGWSLTDDPNQMEKWPFPNITLDSGEYRVIFASGKDRRPTEPGQELHTNFKLDQQGEFLALYYVLDNHVKDALDPQFPPQLPDTAYGRHGADLNFAFLVSPTPGRPNTGTVSWQGLVTPVMFSASRGFYEAPFTLALSTTTPGATIRYTLDGNEPGPDTGYRYAEPILIKETTFVRAAAYKPGWLPADTQTYTYIFPDSVRQQPARPPGFPDAWGIHPINFAGYRQGEKVRADYEMDPEVVTDPRYSASLGASLEVIPSLSLVTAAPNFDIYANPRERGVSWERPVSVELIDPSGKQPGFQINAGIRIQGGAGRWEFMPKHSFRLFFKEQYGPTRMEYPLFPGSPVKTFDTLILRGGVDRSFAGHPDTGDLRQTTYTRDEWLRASQIAMSGVGSHGLFVHLYLNGLYWGLYNVVERPDASFAASYYGGNKDEWYAVSHSGPVSGDNSRFQALLQLVEDGDLSDPERYQAAKSYLDLTAFCDYIILNWYAGNEDWPHNNWYVAGRSTEGPARFFVWDGEDTWNSGAKIYLGRTDMTGLKNVIRPLFNALAQNPDFRMKLADRMYRHLFNDGVLTDANAQARWLEITRPIEQAIIAESARWGDARYEPPIIREDWLKARDNVLAQMEGNAARLLLLARQAGYYPPVDPPAFGRPAGRVEPGSELVMTATDGVIYYTTDGSDPRLPGQATVAPTARPYDEPLVLTATTHIKVRLLAGHTWSALHEALYRVADQRGRVSITEIMYNPVEGNDYEFIELKNTGSAPVKLANMTFDQGITFTFPPGMAPLQPGKITVLVRNRQAFAEKYPGIPVSGVYQGKLSNQGEQVTLKDTGGNIVVSVTYDDENGWPVSADGGGDSLVLKEAEGDNNDPRNWWASLHPNGSPGMDEPAQ